MTPVINTCKSCKWWEDGECDFVNTIHAGKPETRMEIEATADDDSGLEVTLQTGPDFGCIHHTRNQLNKTT